MSDSDAVDLIYEAAFVPDRWDAALSAVKTLVGSAEAAMLMFNEDAPPIIVGSGLDAEQIAEFRQVWRDSPAVRWGLANQPADFVSFQANLPEAVLSGDRAITMLYDRGLYDSVVSVHPLDSGRKLGFMLARAGTRPDFAARDIAMLNALRPHLIRSALIADRLGMERARSLVGVLEGLGLAAAVIGRGNRVMATNALFDDLDGRFVATAFGGVALTDRVRNAQLTAALGRIGAREAAGANGAALSLALPGGGDGEPPLVVHVIPVRGAAYDIMSGGQVVLAVSRLGRSGPPRPELLHGLFDLTPAEARLTQELLAGGSLPAIAARMGRSSHTVRAQLRSVMEKTGTHRQAELTSLLTSL